MNEDYGISTMRFPETVRQRTGMYLNSPNHCIEEIIDNSIDEFTAGFAKRIKVTVEAVEGQLYPTITVLDDGRGIPTQPSRDRDFLGRSQAEQALETLHAGGKFGTASGYKVATSGLNGVGASCVNAVSTSFIATIYHHGTRTVLQYAKGLLQTKSVEEPISDKELQGTEIRFILDETVWPDNQYLLPELRNRLQQLTYLNPGLEITYVTAEGTEVFVHEKGLLDYYRHLTARKAMLADKAPQKDAKKAVGEAKPMEPIHVHKVVKNPKPKADVPDNDITVEVIFGYSEEYTNQVLGFVNFIATSGGDHYAGFNRAVGQAIMSFFKESNDYKNLLKDLKNEDCREGIIGIINIKVMAPRFDGQAKQSIMMPEVQSAVYSSVVEEFRNYLELHPDFVALLADKLEVAVRSRIAAKKAREGERKKKKILEGGNPGKLAACSSKKPEECSLYLVEGDSAAGSAIQGRDSRTQAILPVFGKILNTEKSREVDVVSNDKLMEVVKALRCGIGADFDITKLRYHKIIIMADADVDGFHISTLWITFFYRHMPELIKQGHLYIALSPIYRVTETVGKQEKNYYFFDDEELANFESKHKTSVSYIKGLGELQPIQLWESTMDPEKRRLIQVTVDDGELAHDAISKCMGDDVAVRKLFIMQEADFEKAVV